MKLRITVGVLGILFTLIMASKALAGFARDEDRQDKRVPKTGVARMDDGEEIGKVTDFLVNPATGHIVYAVVSTKRRARTAQSVLVLPWNLARMDSERSIFHFTIDKPTLHRAPRVPVNMLAHAPITQWVTAIDRYWAAKTTHGSSRFSVTGVTPCKATALIGAAVQGDNSMHLGTIQELIFDPDEGSIVYVVLSRQDMANDSHKVFFSLPWKILYVQPGERTVIAIVGTKIVT